MAVAAAAVHISATVHGDKHLESAGATKNSIPRSSCARP
jgi:hypothetical protein